MQKRVLSGDSKHKGASSEGGRSSNIYDQLFKDAFSFVVLAIKLLKEVLSPSEQSILDLSQLRLERDSFAKGLRGDLLFTVPLKKYPNLRVPLFILFEHKSSFSVAILVQILRYLLQIIEFTSKEQGKAVMPPILTVVFSHGKKGLSEELFLHELLPEEWQQELLSEGGDGPFSSLVGDMLDMRLRIINVHSEKFRSRWKGMKSRMILELFHNYRGFSSDDLGVLEVELVGLLQNIENVVKESEQDILLSAAQSYLEKRNHLITLEFFNRCLKQVSDQKPDLVKVEGGKMSQFVPMLERGLREGLKKGRQEGHQKGRQEGHQKGRQEGRQAEKQETIARMLKNNIDIAIIVQATGADEKEILKIQAAM